MLGYCKRQAASGKRHSEWFSVSVATTQQDFLKLMSEAPTPQHNRLLAALPDEVRARLLPDLVLTPLPLGKVLCEPGAVMRHAYFPTDSIVSLIYLMEDGASAEISMVGKDGVVGVPLFMGGESAASRAVVQSAGYSYRLLAPRLKEEFNRNEALQTLMLRYAQALMTQMAQTGVCNRHHAIDQQLCRRLLMAIDRISGHELYMTQELISNMLGVRREGVTEAAGRLQAMGVISYSRGRIKVLDRQRLESLACECYAVVRLETERLLPRGEQKPKAAEPARHSSAALASPRARRKP